MKTILITFILMILFFFSFAQPGTLDKSFGDNGILVNTEHNVERVHTTLQQDGKWIAAGNNITFDDDNQPNSDFLLVRYNQDGSMDTSFGNKGSVTTEFAPDAIDRCYAVSIQPDGKIVAAGTEFTYIPHRYVHVAIVRYNEDGTPDQSFGKEGLIDFAIAPQTDAYVQGMALQPNGKIVVTGNSVTAHNEPHTPFIVRFNADGTPDIKFGNKGVLFLAADNVKWLDISSVLVQPDGKILLGCTYPSFGIFYVLRYLPDGTPDKEFGTDGIVKQGFGNDASAQLTSIALQKDGSIVCGGYAIVLNEGTNIAMVQFTDKGALDYSFGNNGQVITKLKVWSELNHLVLQSDSKIIGAGTLNTNEDNPSFALIRYLSDGTIDSSFGTDGLTAQTMENGLYCSDALLQKDGKILQSGTGYITSTEKSIFVFARYNGDKEQKSIIARIKHWLYNHGISWQGLDNKNISYYSIQYSKSGKGFAEKAKITGAGSSRLHDYNFNVADAGWYRIVAVDRKGYKTFSNKVLVSAGDLTSNASIYSNPVRDYVTVQGLPTNEKANISIANSSGTVLATGVSNGSTQYRAPATNLQPGTYYINITSAGKTETLKFVKE